MLSVSIRGRGAGVVLLLIVVLAAFQAGDRHMDFHPSMSPDGERITYYSYRTDAPDIFVTDVASGVETNITNSEDLWEIEPHWSPTDDRIAYSRGSSMADLEVVVRDLDTGGVLVIDDGVNVVWSPDGRRLSYMKDWNLWIASADGSHNMRIDLDELEGRKSEPAWSPDGTSVFFMHQLTDGGASSIYAVDLESGDYRMVVDGHAGVIGAPVFSRDGRMLYLSGEVAGSAQRVFAYDLVKRGDLIPVAETAAGVQYFPSITPSGDALLVEVGNWATKEFFIYAFPLTDGPAEPKRITGPAPQ
jgi:Tol biopolymer transport system component